MIRFRHAPLALALAALAACNSSEDAGAPAAAGPVEAVPPPAGTTWAQKIDVTAQGVRMGNPEAPIKIVEYGSFTCSHCRDFSSESHEVLERDYVNSGKISFEYRSMIRDPWDLTASLVARCAPPEAYFAFNAALFANQDAMFQQIQSHSQAELQSIDQAPPEQRFVRLAEFANLIEFAKQRGLPEDKVRACLADTKMAQKLTEVADEVVKRYPQFPGTPSFLLNDNLLDSTASWPALKTRLTEAGA